MKPKRILFTGGTGLLSLNWALAYSNESQIFLATHKRKIHRPLFAHLCQINISSRPTLYQDLVALRPDLIVHTAAISNVEHCEQNPVEAYTVNTEYAGNVAWASSSLGIKLIHISTDHLFDGLSQYATEDQKTMPLNIYARSKDYGEKSVLSNDSNAIVLRTNFYGYGTRYRHSFSDNILKTVSRHNNFYAFDDVYFTPILIADLATVAMQLVESDAKGIFNVVGDQRISKYHYSLCLAKLFSLPTSYIKPASIDCRSDLVQRPKDMSLSNKKVCHLLNRSLGTVEDGLKKLASEPQTVDSRILWRL